jgi:hypothetical protein
MPAHAVFKLTLESNAKENVVKEEKCDTRTGDLLLMRVSWHLAEAQQNRNEHVTETLPESSVHEHLSATPALDVRDSDQGKEQV